MNDPVPLVATSPEMRARHRKSLRESGLVPLSDALKRPVLLHFSEAGLLEHALRYVPASIKPLKYAPKEGKPSFEYFIHLERAKPLFHFSPGVFSFLNELSLRPRSKAQVRPLLEKYGLVKRGAGGKATSKAFSRLNVAAESLGIGRLVKSVALEGYRRVYLVPKTSGERLNLNQLESFNLVLGRRTRKLYNYMRKRKAADSGELMAHLGLSGERASLTLIDLASTVNRLHGLAYGSPAFSIGKYGGQGRNVRNKFTFQEEGRPPRVSDYFRGREAEIVDLAAKQGGVSTAKLRSALGVTTSTLLGHLRSISGTSIAGLHNPPILQGTPYRAGRRIVPSPEFAAHLGLVAHPDPLELLLTPLAARLYAEFRQGRISLDPSQPLPAGVKAEHHRIFRRQVTRAALLLEPHSKHLAKGLLAGLLPEREKPAVPKRHMSPDPYILLEGIIPDSTSAGHAKSQLAGCGIPFDALRSAARRLHNDWVAEKRELKERPRRNVGRIHMLDHSTRILRELFHKPQT
ncbi:MAG: hypothetical protein V1708_02190 [Candidatus Micrarchaeota archaeon]